MKVEPIGSKGHSADGAIPIGEPIGECTFIKGPDEGCQQTFFLHRVVIFKFDVML